MTDDQPGTDREKVVSKLPQELRQRLKVRAAELGIDIQDAATDGVTRWLEHEAPLLAVDTAGAENWATWLPTGLYGRLKDKATERGLPYVQGVAQAVTLWLDLHSPTKTSPSGAPPRPTDPSSVPERKVFVNQKGGVGKTAVSAGVAQALAEEGKRVLVVDYDPQGHLTKQLGIPPLPVGGDSLLKHMIGEATGKIADLLVPVAGDRFGGRLLVLPACQDAFLLDVRLGPIRANERALERALKPLEDDIDVTIIDGPPSLGLGVDAALYYSRRRSGERHGVSGVVIPVEAEDSSADAFEMLTNQIAALDEDFGAQIEYLGIVVNKYDARRGYVATSSLELWQNLGEPRVVGVIPDLREQREAVRVKRPLLDYAPNCKQANVLRDIAKEIS
ncbi:ParA family protein [Streptomyces roseoverticillatus]|uniref:ParA family protein n=1 Tax=Streptomyces roseoverticillatus TaxID=66429 RepID=UPI001F46B7D5|nr:ParA family protein [Streptomyces roseoverticillatus]MCF3105377.1 ParA family protein [Streptomyces roseoverticillatus]